MNAMMGEMFWRGQPMSEILAADYDTLESFDSWSKAITRGEVQAAEKARQGRGK